MYEIFIIMNKFAGGGFCGIYSVIYFVLILLSSLPKDPRINSVETTVKILIPMHDPPQFVHTNSSISET